MNQTSREYYSEIKSLIIQRRNQMLVHSCIYYHMADSLITDDKWQQWADELTELQAIHGVEWGYYDEAFKDWDGSTGCHLPTDDAVRCKANNLRKHVQIYIKANA
jgi:hypothetical protein